MQQQYSLDSIGIYPYSGGDGGRCIHVLPKHVFLGQVPGSMSGLNKGLSWIQTGTIHQLYLMLAYFSYNHEFMLPI